MMGSPEISEPDPCYAVSLTLATQCRNVVTVWAPGWGCQAEVRYRKVVRSRVGVEPTEPDTVRSRYRVLVGEVTVGVKGSEWWSGMRDDGKQLRRRRRGK